MIVLIKRANCLDGWRVNMLFALIVMAVIAKIFFNKGYTFERMLPYLLVAGIIAFFIPVGAIIALPFNIIGGIFGTVFGGLGGAFGMIGGVFGIIGGIIGAVFGVIGATIGIVFGTIGVVFGIISAILVPLLIIFVIVKLVR